MTLTPPEAHLLDRLKHLRELQRQEDVKRILNRPWFTGNPEHPDVMMRPARPSQLMPPGDWHIWLILAGRGFGKTRTGAEWCVDRMLITPGSLFAAVGKKWTQVRDVQISAIISVLERDGLSYTYNKSDLEVQLFNGSTVRGYSAEAPDTIRGANISYAWVDELCFIPGAEYLWKDCLVPAVRVGEARILVTTTPRPSPLLKELAGRTDGSVSLVRGSTFDNEANLAASVVSEYHKLYDGTQRGRAELYGEIVEDIAGALWTSQMLEQSRPGSLLNLDDILPHLATVAVGVDPAGRSGPLSDETGIVVAANTGPNCPVCGVRDPQGHLVVFEDASGRYTPTEWAGKAVSLYHKYRADYIVAEQNNGWDMVNTTIQQADRSVPIRKAHATRGKYVRAEPISVLYTGSRAHHITIMPELEEQMMTYTPEVKWSPDRMDAMVWAATYLMIRPKGATMVFRGDAHA